MKPYAMICNMLVICVLLLAKRAGHANDEQLTNMQEAFGYKIGTVAYIKMTFPLAGFWGDPEYRPTGAPVFDNGAPKEEQDYESCYYKLFVLRIQQSENRTQIVVQITPSNKYGEVDVVSEERIKQILEKHKVADKDKNKHIKDLRDSHSFLPILRSLLMVGLSTLKKRIVTLVFHHCTH